MRIWALGDIHSNAAALEAAWALVDANPADAVVILGDLLTYGPQPREVLESVAARVKAGVQLVLGNHDALYLDLLAGDQRYYHRLPAWIRASADWTLSMIDPAVLEGLPFAAEVVHHGALFAHANPWFERPDDGSRWAYLNSEADHRGAARVLRERGLQVGVFGHTHRPRVVSMPGAQGVGAAPESVFAWSPSDPDDVLLVNAGSVGQPRTRGGASTVAELTRTAQGWQVELHPLVYDEAAHRAQLAALPLPDPSRARLVRCYAK